MYEKCARKKTQSTDFRLNQYTLAARHKIPYLTTELHDHHQININVCEMAEFC